MCLAPMLSCHRALCGPKPSTQWLPQKNKSFHWRGFGFLCLVAGTYHALNTVRMRVPWKWSNPKINFVFVTQGRWDLIRTRKIPNMNTDINLPNTYFKLLTLTGRIFRGKILSCHLISWCNFIINALHIASGEFGDTNILAQFLSHVTGQNFVRVNTTNALPTYPNISLPPTMVVLLHPLTYLLPQIKSHLPLLMKKVVDDDDQHPFHSCRTGNDGFKNLHCLIVQIVQIVQGSHKEISLHM